MTCCPPYTQLFADQSVVSVSYGATMKTKFGLAPNIQVYIFDSSTGQYQQAQFLSKKISGDFIIVDMGGLGSGYIKIF